MYAEICHPLHSITFSACQNFIECPVELEACKNAFAARKTAAYNHIAGDDNANAFVLVHHRKAHPPDIFETRQVNVT